MTLNDVLPGTTGCHSPDGIDTHVIERCNVFEHHPTGMQRTNFTYRLRGQLGATRTLTHSHVVHVVILAPEIQVSRGDTWRDIAVVEDPGVTDRSLEKGIRDSVSKDRSALRSASVEESVSVLGRCGGPQPTPLGGWIIRHEIAKDFGIGQSGWSVAGNKSVNTWIAVLEPSCMVGPTPPSCMVGASAVRNGTQHA